MVKCTANNSWHGPVVIDCFLLLEHMSVAPMVGFEEPEVSMPNAFAFAPVLGSLTPRVSLCNVVPGIWDLTLAASVV